MNRDYTKDYCWQYDIRLRNYDEDLKKSGLSESEVANLRVGDFVFSNHVDDTKELIEFIKRHEWLGTISQFPTHWFTARYKGILAGVLIFNVPNAFSKLLGENTKELERLISRGACISWSPKNLASSFIMWSIKWMVANTDYRLFTAYADPLAVETGTIYQACNFYYLGKGTPTRKYENPYTGKMVSDRFFRQKSAYKKFAKELGIEWDKSWNSSSGMLWKNVPDSVEKKLREYSKRKQDASSFVVHPAKRKYAYVLGRDKRETKYLRKLFLERNRIYEYE